MKMKLLLMGGILVFLSAGKRKTYCHFGSNRPKKHTSGEVLR